MYLARTADVPSSSCKGFCWIIYRLFLFQSIKKTNNQRTSERVSFLIGGDNLSNSSLVSYKRISPNKTSPRNHAIDMIIPHCFVGEASVEDAGAWFAQSSAQCSCTYYIGPDGRIGQFVLEEDRSWCTSSREADNRAVTIECASGKTYPYKINDKVLASLIKLMADICKRNGIKSLKWQNNKNLLWEVSKQNIAVHRWFANKECPGQYIMDKLNYICNSVNTQIGAAAVNTATNNEDTEEPKWYRVRLSWGDTASQKGAYLSLDKAKEDCPAGYSVYDYTGNLVYTNNSAAGVPGSKEWYIEQVAKAAMELYPETKILPSPVIAQCCLETGYGLGADSQSLIKVNNLLGMKCELLNSTWRDHFIWDGKSEISKLTPECYDGRNTVYITDRFRAYPDYKSCIHDYENFLLYVKSGANYKYRRIQGVTDPETFMDYLYNNGQGYATDPNYKTKILNLIRSLDLQNKYDSQVLGQTETVEGSDEEMATHPWVSVAKGYNSQMREMVSSGTKWFYSNSGCKTTWASAVKNKAYKTNCAQFLCWILRNQKVLASGQKFWNNAGEIRWKDDDTKKNVKAACDILDVKGKTLNSLITSGTLQAGDMILFADMVHMNMYAGNDRFYDAGTCYEKTHGEGAVFTTWYGKNMYGSERVKWLIRRKGSVTKKTVYRVQVGAFSTVSARDKLANKLAKKGYDTFYEKLSDNLMHLFCGSYDTEAKAKERQAELKSKMKIDSEIKKFTV